MHPHKLRYLALGLLLALLWACQSEPRPQAPVAMPATTTPTKEIAPDLSRVDNAAPTSPAPILTAPLIIKGKTGSAESEGSSPVLSDGLADITINMVDADIAAVIKATLGDALGMPYSLDQEVQGTLSLRTNKPVTQGELLSNLESALFAAGFALIYQDGRFRVATLDRASQSVVFVEGSSPGYGTQAIEMRHSAPSAVAGIISQYIQNGARLSTDDPHGLLLVTGPQPVRRAVADLALEFDRDEMAGRSFGLFPLRFTQPATLVDELSAIFGSADTGIARTELQFVPLDRMNAILVIATRSDLIDQAQAWIDRLDLSDRSQEKRLFVHYVEHGEAQQIAGVLQDLFNEAGEARSGGSTVSADGQPPLPNLMGNGAAPSDVYSDLATGQPVISDQPSPMSRNEADNSPQGGTSSNRSGISASHGPIRIIADDKNNALFILASEQDYKLVQAAIEHLDIGQLQVLIEATIAEVSLTDNLRYGVQWFFEHNNSSITLSRVAAGAVAPTFPGFGYLLSADSATVVIDALDSVTDVNVISAPEVMVLDNRTARLEVGDEVPIATQTAVSTIDPDAPIVNSISYRNTGVILTVQPRVNSSGFVTLTIEQEVSDVVATTTSGIDSPTFRNRRIKSSVTVKDGATIALGGLIRDSKTEGVNGLPVLSKIPVLGILFGSTTNNALRTELLVLLTPRVVRNPAEAETVTHQLKQRLQGLWSLNQQYEQ